MRFVTANVQISEADSLPLAVPYKNPMWQDILKTAIVGTERNALPVSVRSDALGDVLSKLDANAREASLLSAAAAVALYERAGQLPATDSQPLPVPAEADDAPCCNARAAQHLSLMLGNDEYREILREWFIALATARKRVPAESLPMLLNLGKADSRLGEVIVNVIGKRGHWLALQNSEWDYVTGELDESIWETGTQKMRLAFLQKMRTTNPAQARELVASTWQQETPESRVAFVAAFADGLSFADETFLEAALDDRRKDVRKDAANLLARLPESAFVQRMIARVKPLLVFGRKGKIEIILPDECDKAMKRDGIEPKSTYSDKGDKTWWLQQMLSLIPPDIWVAESGWAIDELIHAALNNEWKKLLLESWATANRIARSVGWAEALYAAQVGQENETNLLRFLPKERIEEIITPYLKQNPSLLPPSRNKQFVMSHHKKWSAEFTLLFVESIRYHAQTDAFRTEFWWTRYLINTSREFDFDTLPEIIVRLSQLNTSLPEPLPVLDALITALDIRYTAIKEITQ